LNERLSHGGELEKFSNQYGIAVDQWLDLSTGISPYCYPIPSVPIRIWQRLPEQTDAFRQAVTDYYKISNWLACSGTQSAIQVLPKLWFNKCNKPSQIWLPRVGYKEHEHAWRSYLNSVIQYENLPEANDLTQNCVVVVINPNNPTGQVYQKQVLLNLANNLKEKNGLLVIDEAFIDCEQEEIFFKQADDFTNLIILRSMGKFFGLAGLRVGFVLSNQEWLSDFENVLGIWSVTGPSLYIAERALKDVEWQKMQKQRLFEQGNKLTLLLKDIFDTNVNGTSLFKSFKSKCAVDIHHQLCKHGVLVRLCDEKDRLRFGIPDNAGFERISSIMSKLKQSF